MRILGIELGSWSVKAVELESRFRRLEVLDLHEIRLPLEMLDPLASYKEATSRLLAQLPSHPEKVVTSLPSNQMALRFSKVPIKQRGKVEQMFRLDLQDNIPFNLEDSMYEHQIKRLGNESLVFAAIAPKKQVKAHINWLNAIGLDPDWLTFEGMGLINLYLQSHKEKEDEEAGPILLIDFGHTKMNLAFINKGVLEYFRSITVGGLLITKQIAAALNTSLEEAEKAKIEELDFSSPSESPVYYAGQQGLQTIMTDIQHSLAAYRSLHRHQISAVYLAGGCSQIKGIEKVFEAGLNTPTQFFLEKAGLNFPKAITSDRRSLFSEALGRSLVFTRKAALLFNFRKQELAKGTSLTQASQLFKNPTFVTLAKFSVILIAILFIYVLMATPAAKKNAEQHSEGLQKVFISVFRTVPTKLRKQLTSDSDSLRQFIDRRNKELDQKLKMAKGKQTRMLDFVLAISDSFGRDVKVDINTLSVDDRQFVLEGVLYSGKLEIVMESLKSIPGLNNLKVTESEQRFTIRGEIRS